MKQYASRLRYTAFVCCIALFVPMLSTPLQALQVSALPPAEAWQKDARVKHALSIDVVAVDVEAVLRVCSDSSLTLSCDADCARQKVQIRLKQRPVGQLMQALAQLLPGEWHPLADGHGYKLVMDSAAARYRERWWFLFTEGRKKAFQQQAEYLLQEMRQAPVSLAGSAPSAPQATNRPDGVPTQETSRAFFHALPEALQRSIAEHSDDSAFYSVSSTTFTPVDDENTVLLPWANLPPDAQRLINDQKVPAADGYIRFVNAGLDLSACLFSSEGKQLSNWLSLSGLGNNAGFQAANLSQDQLVALVQQLGKRAPSEWKRLAAYRQKTVWNNRLPVKPAYSAAPLRRADLLRWFVGKTDMEFVADYYTQSALLGGAPLPPTLAPADVETELNARAREQDMSWKKQGDLYLFRNNRWYRDDFLEVPSALAAAWLHRFTAAFADARAFAGSGQSGSDASGRITLDVPQVRPAGADAQARLEWEAEATLSLSRWQINNGLLWLAVEPTTNAWGTEWDGEPTKQGTAPRISRFPLRSAAQRLALEYNLARFYASLTPQERGALCRNALRYSELSPAQRQQAQLLAPRLIIALASHPAETLALRLEEARGLYTKSTLGFALNPVSESQ